jgi:CheY-like chemotaxis protein
MKNQSHNLVFIVDDDPDDRKIILDALHESHAEINHRFYENATELLTHLGTGGAELPSLILLDLNMPGTLGLQALKEIRSNKAFNQIPIVVLTTSSLGSDRKSSYELGANCFLTKPDSFTKLLEVIAAISLLWLDNH